MAAGRATETSDSDWASCRRVRICLVSTDRRPLRRVDLQARDEDPLLAATVNMQYAARHDYAFVLTSYRAAALDGRAYGWSKVAVLGELMDTWPEVEAFAFLDADASINTARRLESLPAVGRFLSNPERLVFFVNSDASRAGPPSKWASWTDEHGRLPSRQEYADRARVMREWWDVPERYAHMRMYKTLWPHCQRAWDDILRPKYASHGLLAEAAFSSKFNTPRGVFVIHQYFKSDCLRWKRQMARLLHE
jgi:hypothetical protein